ncbi:hypothetical protein CCACVL1_12432 [Corchorus capsularis]|uniref:Uncharacterized protein n=1 Tax=Corchorus capsularis TaxID=210143 RepID=A0A1R3IFN1_COCAP|nr:hypothetical protein CCACVL1_12432 [Corchorus capsularis]
MDPTTLTRCRKPTCNHPLGPEIDAYPKAKNMNIVNVKFKPAN